MAKSNTKAQSGQTATRPLTPSDKVRRRIKGEFDVLFAQPATPIAIEVSVTSEVLAWLQNVLSSKELSYRDAVVVQLAYRLNEGAATNVTIRHEGGRSVAAWLGKYLRANHVRAVGDAFQNIGKNSANLVRGNNPDFDNILKWASDQPLTTAEGKVIPVPALSEVEAVFKLACVRIAANARAVRALPPLNRSKLTFAGVCQLLGALYDIPSGGAYEQFSIAALLHALVEQQGQASFRVETKNLNASDRSSGTAGDIQLLIGNRIVEAIEVTANDWREKLSSTAKTIKDNDLSRLTIVANGVAASGSSLFRQLSDTGLDLSVLEVRPFAHVIVATLTRQGRASAITRFYEMLDRLQPDVAVVNQLVTTLIELSLCEQEDAQPR